MAEVEELKDQAGIVALAAARARLGISVQGTTEEVAHEWWRRASTNPSGRNVHLVVKEQGEIVASGSYSPKTFSRNGEHVLVAEIGGTFTAPEAQGKGCFSSLVRELVSRASRSGVRALYGTPNQQSGRIYIDRLGWTPLERWTRWLRPSSRLIRPIVDLPAVVRSGRGPQRAVFEVQDPAISDDSVDASRAASNHFLRSAEQFAWRYPASHYRMITCKVDDETVAWCVAGRTVRLGQPTAAIADFGIGEGLEWAARGLVAHAGREIAGSRLVFGATLRNGHHRVWRSLGAIPRASVMPLIAHSAADSDGDRLFDTMVFDIGDSDTV